MIRTLPLTVADVQCRRNGSDQLRRLCGGEATSAADTLLVWLGTKHVGVVKANNRDGLGLKIEWRLRWGTEVRSKGLIERQYAT